MKNMMVVMLVLCMVTSLAQAGITGTNILLPRNSTMLADGSPAIWAVASGYKDGQWRDRSLDVASPWAGVPDILPQSFLAQSTYGDLATTTVSGLTAGQTYKVWVLFSVALTEDGTGPYGGKRYDIMSAFNGNPLTNFGYSNSTNTGLVSRDEATMNYTVFEGLIGETTADSAGTIAVAFDFPKAALYPSVNWTTDRTIYHGLAYTAVPEPATMALIGFGGLALLRKRK